MFDNPRHCPVRRRYRCPPVQLVVQDWSRAWVTVSCRIKKIIERSSVTLCRPQSVIIQESYWSWLLECLCPFVPSPGGWVEPQESIQSMSSKLVISHPGPGQLGLWEIRRRSNPWQYSASDPISETKGQIIIIWCPAAGLRPHTPLHVCPTLLSSRSLEDPPVKTSTSGRYPDSAGRICVILQTDPRYLSWEGCGRFSWITGFPILCKYSSSPCTWRETPSPPVNNLTKPSWW